MDEIHDPVQLWFTSHVDAVYRTLDALQPAIAEASAALLDALLGERRVLVCGTGAGAALGQLFASALLARPGHERPPLPVQVLGGDAVALGAIADAYGFGEALARQVQALAQPGDVLLLVGTAATTTLAAAARAAQARSARVIWLDGESGTEGVPPGSGDIWLRVPSDEPARIAECQLLMLNSLAGLLDIALFGSD